MERTGHHPVLDRREPGQVGLHVRTSPLDVVAGELERALRRPVLRVEALGVLEPLDVEALEPGVDVVVVRPAPMGAEAHREEQLVHPVLDVLADEVVDEVAVDLELVARVLVVEGAAHPSLLEVDDDPLIADIEQDRLVDPGADHVRLLEERIPPCRELREEVDARPLPGGPLRRDDRTLARPIGLQVRTLVVEDRRRIDRMADIEPAGCHIGDRAREHQPATIATVLLEIGEEGRLVGERVPLVTVQVVELEEVVVEEARRPGRGHDERRVEDLHVAERPRELRDPLLVAEDLLGVVGVVVDHRVPDGSGELEEQRIQRPVREEPVRLGRARVVHVQHADLAVVDDQRGVADRAVGRGDEGVDGEGQRSSLERHEIAPTR